MHMVNVMVKKILSICHESAILFLFFIVSTSIHAFNMHNPVSTFYVSSSKGNDKNSGASPQSPRQSISSINTKENVIILLKRGDVFFENIHGYKKTIISSYGSGDKPILCGFKILKNSDAWMQVSDSVWCLDLKNESNFEGYLSDRCKNKKTINNVGFIYSPKTDHLYGHLVPCLKDLQDEDFFTSDVYKPKQIQADTFKFLYWKTGKNPRDFPCLCFSMFEHGVSNMDSCQISNISIVGFSGHGICNSTNLIVDSCHIDLIGGAVFLKERWWSRYGNGVEFWADENTRNCYVRNCIVSRTYDCGMTIQYSGKENSYVHNIHFIGNKLYHCRQAFEYFINSSNSSSILKYEDCEFSKNICLEMGLNEFNSPEQRDASILCYDNEIRVLNISYNFFYGSSYYCGQVRPVGMKNNTVYIYRGQYLNNYHAKRNYPAIIAEDKESIKKYKLWSGDNSRIHIITHAPKKFAKERRALQLEIKKTSLSINKFCNEQIANYEY